jgi:nicotinamidase-related amidase
MTHPWDDVISAEDLQRYDAAGFGRPSGIGATPALLVIDVQYRTLGDSPKPFDEAVKDYPTAVGQAGWDAAAQIERLIASFRAAGRPILYPHVAPKLAYDAGTLGAKVPAIMNVAEQGYRIPDHLAPRPQDIMLPKKHPSAFFGTPLVSYLIDLGVDTLVVTGCSTSGCVRATVVDGFAYNFKAIVPHDAVYDRSELVHKVNLFDMGQKYADVMSTDDALALLDAVEGGA